MKAKAYTDLEQSCELAKFLPHDSADMFYSDIFTGEKHKYNFHYLETYGFKTFEDTKLKESKHLSFIPCWSLSALLSILKDEIILENGHIMFFHHNKYNNGDEIRYTNSWTGEVIKTEIYSHLVDTCFEMIIKLHEKKLI